ncbi:2-keto-4-pentenoate hydratase/2-oxohepta-3-ene-1,7-dioic acid hydratase in catechol pathway [Stackebrandtia albiflava]|uniref:2-keto-4-pentenoate hydratase/2-oxohepta-3-ene-1,7-dioic acid hydratase in catechol pathway n=1 Tax=Stackebrandtia albiflava TaxID=406432 RepID=A0A562VA28_9ACTN|nr:fumarylacetoacetate hydrolase family protein [Stackebrandtia albiflava]TWJ14667.1 2-keto-4-pentenoate hydratase/2-oxohepta-3-ene-1,7-dioic acid hydratase in catechol pathway [Stackebrandtia albiflava]
MRIARVAHARGMSFGVLNGEGAGATVSEIEGHPFGSITTTGQRWALDDVRLMAPILPSKVVCVGRNYAAHAAERGAEVPSEPLLFLKPSTSVIGPGDPIRIPPQSQQVEHEAELAVVIGVTGARRVTDRAQAEAAIFGYTCANDVTARDLQNSDNQWTRAKGFDSFCPIGPWIDTDLDVSDVEVRCEVNDSVRQLGRTKDMVFSPATLVSYVSHIMTLLPGDVILTGTPEGIEPVVPGDTVEVSVEGIGTLTNPVVSLD